MKWRFYLAFFLIIVSLITSCSKERFSSQVFKNDGSIADSSSNDPRQTIHLIADNWKKDENGVYNHNFQNILPLPGYGRRVRVYAITEDRELQINDPILFTNGKLWATYTTTDVKISFQCPDTRPFSSLDIKAVIE